ncbi:MAG: 50S ribosomal protein L40e [Candidatus Aenigmarchaeota archaeon]|nr:50S ribosomal protein L40e [Candidatus Aenigmarchaeota archaeon]
MGIAGKRLFENVFVCMSCHAKMRTTMDKVKRRKIKCRKCGSKDLRPKAKERRGAKT